MTLENESVQEELDFEAEFENYLNGLDEEDSVTEEDVNLSDTPQDEPEQAEEESADNEESSQDHVENTPVENEETPAMETPSDEPDWRALYELEQQRLRSLEGRMRAEADRRKKETPEEKPAAPKEPELTPELKEFYDEYPELVKPIEALMKARVDNIKNELTKNFEERINPLVNRISETENNSHMDAINRAHPDWKTIVDSGKLDKWQASLPPFVRAAVENVRNSGSTQEVIEMLSQFKADNNITTPKETKPATPVAGATPEIDFDPLVEKLRAALAVSSPKSGEPKETRKANKDDFDAAWEEAARLDK